jgi:hypothetical protein
MVGPPSPTESPVVHGSPIGKSIAINLNTNKIAFVRLRRFSDTGTVTGYGFTNL